MPTKPFHPDFIWLVHPLDAQQLQEWADKHRVTVAQLVKEGPKIVDIIIDNKAGMIGCAISTPLLPRELLKRKNVMAQLQLIKEMIDPTVPVGLGAWWATVTRCGKLAREVLDNPIIDGYTGTINRIVEQVIEETHYDNPNLLIIGGGVVGRGVADKLPMNTIYDKYKWRELQKDGYDATNNDELVRHLRGGAYDIGVCCVTDTSSVITLEDIPKGFKFIDDSYPHAIPDYEGRIEGGMYDAPEITSDWLIEDGKVFGCLMELIEYTRKIHATISL